MEVWPGSLERINLVEPSQSMQRAGQSLFKGMVHRVLGLFNCICIFLKIAVLLICMVVLVRLKSRVICKQCQTLQL